jgi:glucosamine kinase
MTNRDSSYFLGIDGGGTKCRAIIQNAEGKTLGQGQSGTANPVYGTEEAQQSIVQAAKAAIVDANLPANTLSDLIAGVGLAGVDIPRFYAAMMDWKHPFSQCFITHDLPIACLGAHQTDEGAVIITGTGSSGYVRCKNNELFLGGYGLPCSDQASGAWLGVKALDAIFLANDSLGPETVLAETLTQALAIPNTNDDLADWTIDKPNRAYAQLAPLIIEQYQKDSVATKILDSAIDYLTQLAHKLLETPDVELALIGGLSHFYHEHLSQTFQSRLIKPKSSPEVGAILFAKQKIKKI